jgi:Pentapeptide repeats (8 copies)
VNNLTPKQDRRVRFEEVTPTNTIVAFFDARLSSLVTRLHLPIYKGYDDLDEMQLAFLTLPSGQTVTLAQYENAPQIGVDIYVDLKTQNVPAVVFESCQYLEIPRSDIPWFHPDFQEQIDSLFETLRERLYLEDSDINRQIQLVEVDELSIDNSALEQHPPTRIDCFHHALRIYTREDFPLYWAMLQHNLGLAYFDRTEGKRQRNLEISIECFNSSLEIYTENKFPDKWQINQDDIAKSKKLLSLYRKKLIKDILNRSIPNRKLKFAKLSRAKLSRADLSGANLIGANLSGADLSGANLIGADLSGANLNRADLSGADLSRADLIGAKLSRADLIGAKLSRAKLIGANLTGAKLIGADLIGANLSDANLTGANVKYARFELAFGITQSLKQDLIARGAIFDDTTGDRSESRNLVPR